MLIIILLTLYLSDRFKFFIVCFLNYTKLFDSFMSGYIIIAKYLVDVFKRTRIIKIYKENYNN